MAINTGLSLLGRKCAQPVENPQTDEPNLLLIPRSRSDFASRCDLVKLLKAFKQADLMCDLSCLKFRT